MLSFIFVISSWLCYVWDPRAALEFRVCRVVSDVTFLSFSGIDWYLCLAESHAMQWAEAPVGCRWVGGRTCPGCAASGAPGLIEEGVSDGWAWSLTATLLPVHPTVGHASSEIMHSWSRGGVWLEQLGHLFSHPHTVGTAESFNAVSWAACPHCSLGTLFYGCTHRRQLNQLAPCLASRAQLSRRAARVCLRARQAGDFSSAVRGLVSSYSIFYRLLFAEPHFQMIVLIHCAS